jgi:hypothetical protein
MNLTDKSPGNKSLHWKKHYWSPEWGKSSTLLTQSFSEQVKRFSHFVLQFQFTPIFVKTGICLTFLLPLLLFLLVPGYISVVEPVD